MWICAKHDHCDHFFDKELSLPVRAAGSVSGSPVAVADRSLWVLPDPTVLCCHCLTTSAVVVTAEALVVASCGTMQPRVETVRRRPRGRR